MPLQKKMMPEHGAAVVDHCMQEIRTADSWWLQITAFLLTDSQEPCMNLTGHDIPLSVTFVVSFLQ